MARARCATPEDCVQEAFVRLAKQDKLPDDPMAWLNGMDLDGTDSRVSREAIRYSQPSPTVPPEIEVENEIVPETIPLKTPRGLKLQEELLRLFQKV